MIMAVVGIRQAVKNQHFDQMNHLEDGFVYGASPATDFVTALVNQVGVNQTTNFTPFALPLARYYTVFGEDPARVAQINATIAFLTKDLPFKFGSIDNITDEGGLFDFVRSNSYQRYKKSDSLLFAIQVPAVNKYDYTIYMSANFPPLTPNTLLIDKISSKPNLDNFNNYARNGYVSLQYLLADLELKKLTADNNAEIEAYMTIGKTKEFTKDEFMDNIGPNLALFILLIFIAPQYRLVGFVTEEKASRAREGMKIMGLSDTPYWTSWFIYYFFVCLTISICCSVLMTVFLFPNSSWFFLFLHIFLYGMSLFSFSLLISSFLQRPKIACILATLIHFITYFMVLLVNEPTVSYYAKGILSFIPNIAMALSVGALTKLESNGNGLNGASLNELVLNYKVGIAFTTWTIMFFVQFLLALYFDNVLPKEFGIRQPWLYFLSKNYWMGKTNDKLTDEQKRLLDQGDQDDENAGNKKDFEAVPPNIKQLERDGEYMNVNKLRKIYPNGKEAVKSLSLKMYQGQIFALLGHNGAGKTTTLSILTGLYPATAGTASVFNLNMFDQVNEVRKILGVCPQFDILFDLLTPIEHLQFYCILKGVSSDKIEEEVTKTIKDVDLQSKKTAYAKNLSGGQKRKLSVGIAMIGGSKLVLLDEPTSGMDLTARRKIWDMLKNNKQGRILILTTHFMDEADILGDRIAIMAGGRIKCCGGSLFLKKRFGVGYNLVIAKENKDPNPRVDEFIKERIPDAIKLSEVSSEVTYQIPQTESDKFESFFTDLDQSLRDLRIKSYGVGVTTLEEVFLRVGKQDEEEEESKDEGSKKSLSDIKKEVEEEKRQIGNGVRSLNKTDDLTGIDEYSIADQSEQNIFLLHFWALSVKRFLVSFRQLRSSLLEILIPIILIIVGLALATVDFFKDPTPVILSDISIPNPNIIYHGSIGTPTSQEAVDSYFGAFGNTDKWNLTEVSDLTRDDLNKTLGDFENLVFNGYNAYDSKLKNLGNHLVYNMDADAHRYQVVGFANPYLRDSAPLQMQLMLNGVMKAAGGDNAPQLEFKVSPFPLTATATAGAKAGSGSIVAFLFAIALAMIPAGVASSIVQERESNVKHQQFISGASMISYWISNYFVDFVRSLLPISVAIIFVFIFGVDLPDVWILFLLFAIAIHPFTYATTFWFKKENVASTLTIMIHIFGGGFLAIAILVLQSFPSTRDAAKVIKWFPKILPSFCVISAILSISTRQIIARATGSDKLNAPLSWDVAGGDAMFLGIDFFFWWAVVILCENKFFGISFRRGRTAENLRRTENIKIDDDVRAEDARCLEVSPNECSVLVQNLRKVYPSEGQGPVIAVRNISFGLEYGE